MTAAPFALSTVHSNALSTSQGQHRSKQLEKSFRKKSHKNSNLDRHTVDADLAWVGKALWRALPEAQSENELCELAAQVLSTADHTVTPRTVKNWVRGDNTPHFRYIRSILVMAGAEAVFNLIDAEAA